jgi:hypothetical protein
VLATDQVIHRRDTAERVADTIVHFLGESLSAVWVVGRFIIVVVFIVGRHTVVTLWYPQVSAVVWDSGEQSSNILTR